MKRKARAPWLKVPLRGGGAILVRETIGNDFTTMAYHLEPAPAAKCKRKARP